MRDMRSIQIQHLRNIKSTLENKEKDHIKATEETQYEIWQKEIESTIFKESSIGSSDPNRNLTRVNKLDKEVEDLKAKLTKLKSVSFSDEQIVINSIDNKLSRLDPNHQNNDPEEEDYEEYKDSFINW